MVAGAKLAAFDLATAKRRRRPAMPRKSDHRGIAGRQHRLAIRTPNSASLAPATATAV